MKYIICVKNRHVFDQRGPFTEEEVEKAADGWGRELWSTALTDWRLVITDRPYPQAAYVPELEA